MSNNLFSKDGVGISIYTGPELPFSDNRRRYQITNLDTGALITLDLQQWKALGEWFSKDGSAKERITEYGVLLSGGGYQTWNTEPYIEKIYPLAEKIEAHRKHGKVYRRRIIVVEDWTEVSEP